MLHIVLVHVFFIAPYARITPQEIRSFPTADGRLAGRRPLHPRPGRNRPARDAGKLGHPGYAAVSGGRGASVRRHGHTKTGSALPLPAVQRDPLDWRLKLCRHYAGRTRTKLEVLRRAATAYEARFAALPTLCAYPVPVADPEMDAGWLTIFEIEAKRALRDTYGAGPQLLLAARLAGLEREAEVLAAGLAELLPAEAPAA